MILWMLTTVTTRIPETFDWPTIVTSLTKAGLPISYIASKTGFSITELRDMQSGVWEPQWISILKLLDMFYDLKETLEQVALSAEDELVL